ncbi:MAG: AAA family ATPase [Anaerolineales bacterium]|nr:AAA family ATPase [Anaerolineales bacterium]
MTLLERTLPLAALDTALRDAVRGVGRFALVTGEAGIGKTALVEHFAQSRPAGARQLWGACDSLSTPRPLGPLHDMALEIRGQLPTLLNAQSQRHTLFSTMLVELQNRPTLAVIEDLHWADEATLDLLAYLGRRIERTTALVVLTCREDELGLTHPVRALLNDLEGRSVITRIPLEPLTVVAVRQLLGERTDLDAREVHRRTAGNPFFVTEAIASGAAPSATVRDAVLARAARLSSTGQRLIEAAAILGVRCEGWALTDVSGIDASVTPDAELAGLLRADGSHWVFRHELARQAILDSIPPMRRTALHAQALAALRHAPETQTDLARLAHHAVGAGNRDDVLTFAPVAARQAAAVGAHRAAAELFRRALDVADELPVAERATLWESFARERGYLEPRKDAIAAHRQAAALWREAGNPQKLGESLAQVAMGVYEIGPKSETGQAIDAALEVLEELAPSPMLMITYRTQALWCLANAEDDRAITLAEQARSIAVALGDPSVIGSALEGLGLCWLAHDTHRACDYLERSLALQREARADLRYSSVCANLGSVYCEQFRFADAERVLGEGIPHAVERDLDRLLAFMEGWQALMWMHQGRWAESLGLANRSLKRATSGKIPALITLGRIRARRGEATAGEILQEALTVGLRIGNLQRLGLTRAASAEGAWLAGDVEQTREHARALYDVAAAKHLSWAVGELAYWRWRAGDDVLPLPDWTARPFALHIAGDWRGAAEAWERLGCPYEQARALADGDVPAQVTALAIFDRLGALPAAATLREAMQAAGVRRIPRGPRPAARANPFGLTARQSTILALIDEGLTNVEIAARLQLAPKTVENTITALLRKLGARTRHEAVEKARRAPSV